MPKITRRAEPRGSKGSKREFAFRYLAWLDLKRRCLAHELKSTSDGKVAVPVDDIVEDFFYPLFSGKRSAMRSSARTEKMLRAAGISIGHDPKSLFFGDDRPSRGTSRAPRFRRPARGQVSRTHSRFSIACRQVVLPFKSPVSSTSRICATWKWR
jgi:hypothetical protein